MNIYKITKTTGINEYNRVRYVEGVKSLKIWLYNNSHESLEKIEKLTSWKRLHGCRVEMQKLFSKNSDRAVDVTSVFVK